MAKQDIVKIVSAKAGVDLLDTEKVIDSFLDYIGTELVAGRSVVLVGFGSFRYKEYPGYKDADLSTSGSRRTSSRAGISFRPGIPLVDRVHEAYAKRRSENKGSAEVVEHFMKEVLAVPSKKGRSSTKVVIRLPENFACLDSEGEKQEPEVQHEENPDAVVKEKN